MASYFGEPLDQSSHYQQQEEEEYPELNHTPTNTTTNTSTKSPPPYKIDRATKLLQKELKDRLKKDWIPKTFTLDTLVEAQQYYSLYGYVVINILHDDNWRHKKNHFTTQVNLVTSYISQVTQMATTIPPTSIDEDNNSSSPPPLTLNPDPIITPKLKPNLLPNKLNFGIVSGTLFETSPNATTLASWSKRKGGSSGGSSGMEYSGDPNSKEHCNEVKYKIDDSIAQSSSAWMLRSFCLDAYCQLLGVTQQDLMMASIESSTYMASEETPLGKVQKDNLHFLSKIFTPPPSPPVDTEPEPEPEPEAESSPKKKKRKLTLPLPLPAIDEVDTISHQERLQWPRGILSLTPGDSVSLIPYFHHCFETFQNEMISNNYTLKRTCAKAISPPAYRFEKGSKYLKRIPLREGDYLIYDPRIPIKLQTPNSRKGEEGDDEDGEFTQLAHITLKVMFFDPHFRGFNDIDYAERTLAVLNGYILNSEKITGECLFEKRRGERRLLPGKYQPPIPTFLVDPNVNNPYCAIAERIAVRGLLPNKKNNNDREDEDEDFDQDSKM